MKGIVIFDVDGTLVDSSEGILIAVKEAFSLLKMPEVPEEDIRSLIGPPIDQGVQRLLGLSKTDREVFKKEFRSIYYSKYLMNASLYPGIMDVLIRLHKDYILAVATNKEKNNTVKLLQKLGVIEYFEYVEGSFLENVHYPKSVMINNILKKSGFSKEQSVMVGDGISDYDAASDSGTRFVGVSYGYGNISDVCSSAAESPKDLLEMIPFNS